MFLNYQKKQALKSYIKKLPSSLAKSYGKSDVYTPMQVLRSLKKENLSERFSIYALAIFSSVELVGEYEEQIDISQGIQGAHDEVSELLFDGNNDFNAYDINVISSADSFLPHSLTTFDAGGSDGGE
jgi:hypothetical protein